MRKGINRDYHNVGQIIDLRGDTFLRRDECISIESCDREKKDNNRFYSKILAGNLTQNIKRYKMAQEHKILPHDGVIKMEHSCDFYMNVGDEALL